MQALLRDLSNAAQRALEAKKALFEFAAPELSLEVGSAAVLAPSPPQQTGIANAPPEVLSLIGGHLDSPRDLTAFAGYVQSERQKHSDPKVSAAASQVADDVKKRAAQALVMDLIAEDLLRDVVTYTSVPALLFSKIEKSKDIEKLATILEESAEAPQKPDSSKTTLLSKQLQKLGFIQQARAVVFKVAYNLLVQKFAERCVSKLKENIKDAVSNRVDSESSYQLTVDVLNGYIALLSEAAEKSAELVKRDLVNAIRDVFDIENVMQNAVLNYNECADPNFRKQAPDSRYLVGKLGAQLDGINPILVRMLQDPTFFAPTPRIAALVPHSSLASVHAAVQSDLARIDQEIEHKENQLNAALAEDHPLRVDIRNLRERKMVTEGMFSVAKSIVENIKAKLANLPNMLDEELAIRRDLILFLDPSCELLAPAPFPKMAASAGSAGSSPSE